MKEFPTNGWKKTTLNDFLKHLKEWFVRFQQDNAPARRARDVVELLRHSIPPDLWPANSPDLNPVDYSICGCVQQRVYQ